MQAPAYDVGKLCEAIRHDRKVLEPFRRERLEAVRQYAGGHWGSDLGSGGGARQRVPLNLIGLYVAVMSHSLVPQNPRVMLNTSRRDLKPLVATMQSWANKQIVRQKFDETLRRIVIDGLFSMGIAKVSISTPADSAIHGFKLGAGVPSLQRVDLDDFVFDTHARDLSQVSYIGHRYRAPLDVVKAMPNFREAKAKLAPSADPQYNQEGDERLSHLGRGDFKGTTDEFEDFVDLWEIYLPRHGVVLTLEADVVGGASSSSGGGFEDVLSEQEWIGPYCGPYIIYSLGDVPGNPMPIGPIQNLIDIHEAANRTYRKLIRQTDRQKTLGLVQGGATEDGQRVIDANDGDVIRVDNPERFSVLALPGPDQQLHAMGMHLKDLFDFMSGNLSLMAGLGAQSPTATQDKMLNENSSRAIQSYQTTTISFTAKVLEAMLWFWHHDPHTVMNDTWEVPGAPEFSIDRQVGPEQRTPEIFDGVETKVDPYSMQHSTPEGQMTKINGVVQNVIMPMMAQMSEQGLAFDMNAYLRKVGEYLNMPELSELVSLREPAPPAQPGGGEGDQGAMPPETTRNYVRESVSTRTQKGNDMNLMNTLMGGSSGDAERQQQMMGA